MLAVLFPAMAASPTDDLLAWMNTIAQKQLDRRQAAIEAIHDTAGAAQRQAFVRAKILELIGGLPDYDGPLNARVTGRIEQPGYVIEKIIFESLPHFYVTANLYRPNRDGRFPAVLLPVGHWDSGKAFEQRIAANLALKGFVAFTYDPIGQGERPQAYDARWSGSLAGMATEQHTLAGAKATLINETFARYRIWDAKRALDYLTSRPEVDAERIGCTGCSGGGTITTYISALDVRIKVAAPACYMNSFRLLFTGPVGDAEQSIPGFLSAGLDLPDYIELFAPKPWLIASTEQDFFPLAGAKLAFEEAQRWYQMYGADDRIRWVVGPGEHGTPVQVREAIYDWMLRWLQNGQGSSVEQDVQLFPEFQLWATRSGEVATIPGSRDIFAVLRDRLHELLAPGTKSDFPRVQLPRVDPAVMANGDLLTFQSERELRLSGRLLLPPETGPYPAVLLIDDPAHPSPRALELQGKGNVVLQMLPRGLPIELDGRNFSGDWLANTRAALIGQSLPLLRARDMLAAVNVLAALPQVDRSRITAEAADVPGIWLLFAAAADPRISHVTLNRTPYSVRDAVDEVLGRGLSDVAIPGLALTPGFPLLVAPARVTWMNPTDWMQRVIARPGAYIYTAPEQ